MENQPQESLGTSFEMESTTYTASASLFAAIMSRVDTLHEHATRHVSLADLLANLEDPHWEVRVGALHNLANQRESLPLESLEAALLDEHPSVRVAAVHALGKLGERVPLDHFILALQDRDAEVRAMAMQVLEEQREHRFTPLLAQAYGSNLKQPMTQVDKQPEALTSQDNGITNTHDVRAEIERTAKSTKFLQHSWLVFSRQLIVLRLNLVAGIACLIACYLFAFVTLRSNLSTMLMVLTWISLLFTGIGTSIITNSKQDHTLELALATPSSPRFILLCRWLLIVGPQLLLALIMTCNVALFYSQSISSIVQLWIVPMLAPLLFVAALALVSTLLLKSWLVYVIMSFVPTIRLPDGHWLLLNISPYLLLVLAVFCLAIAFFDPLRQTWRGLRTW